MASEREHRRLQKVIEQQLGWGKATGWHSSMFSELSEKIFTKCQVMLSAATLKRFFGVLSHDGSPSISTLDALSQFIGYENWRAFTHSSSAKREPRANNLPKKSLYVSAGFVLAILTIIIISTQRPVSPELLEAISFSSRPVGNSYPNSVVFDFDLKNISSDSVYIQQYWDTSKTILLNRDQEQATGIYYFPGYFRAKLVVDGLVVKEHDLFLKSDGWLGTVEYEPVPKYFKPINSDQAALTYPEQVVKEIIKSESPLVSVYNYIDDLGNISGDNFTLQATLRNTFNQKWAVCESARIYVIGTTGAMIIPLSTLGCSSDNNLMLNDVYLSGKEHDLSAFSAELSKTSQIEVEVQDQTMALSIDGNEVYKGKYQQSMGRFVGLRFKFLGLGEVAQFTLLDQNMRPIELER